MQLNDSINTMKDEVKGLLNEHDDKMGIAT